MSRFFEPRLSDILSPHNPFPPDEAIRHLRDLSVRRSGRTTREVDYLVLGLLVTGGVKLPNDPSSESAHLTRVLEGRLYRELTLAPKQGYYKARHQRYVHYSFHDPNGGQPFNRPAAVMLEIQREVNDAVQKYFTRGFVEMPDHSVTAMVFSGRLHAEHGGLGAGIEGYIWPKYDDYQQGLRQIRAEIARLSNLHQPKTSPL